MKMRTSRHDVDAVSLAAGVIFLAVAVWWLLGMAVDVRGSAAGWIVAGGLVLFGLLGLAGAVRSGPRRPSGR